jgi:opacity protein-like surface antigen
MKKTIVTVLAGFLAMGAAQAQTSSADAPHAYVGIGVGAVKDSISGDHKRSTKIFGGYEFDQNWAVEAGYSYLGKSGFYTPLPDDLTHVSVKSQSVYAAAKYTVPLTERTSVYGKLGLAHAETRYSSEIKGWDTKGNRNGVYGAVGVQTKLTENVSLFAEYERNGKQLRNGADNKVFGAGVKYGF